MGDEQIVLTHIALYVTNLQRSMDFYKKILRMNVSEPISLKDQSTGLKYGHSLVTKGPVLVRNLITRANPSAYQQMFTDICHCSTADGTVNLILVQQTHPEKGYIRSVTGNTLYGFSCYLTSDIDTDDLAWDMSISDLIFQHGDTGTDGLDYSLNSNNHSLFIKDPDGRMIELITSSDRKGEFITGLGYAVIYVNNIQASRRFYQEKCGLLDITPQSLVQNEWKKKYVWMGSADGSPAIILYQVINPDGTPTIAGGYGLDHMSLSVNYKGEGAISEPGCVTMHPPNSKEVSGNYLQDPDGYLIEIMK
ncbi:MAG TPA: VOC family protein [Methanospirillum sp.]|uniref:VOC family protein n=1 Tax=Methanospirillum sp. TaxID=45200 RepID=UPI002CD79F50|nr:VOC family protein [Methanospirillum sp.]HWQ63874.1 VOC family protein [Methanospirillum sp.]